MFLDDNMKNVLKNETLVLKSYDFSNNNGTPALVFECEIKFIYFLRWLVFKHAI
jgi:hypothetical protein